MDELGQLIAQIPIRHNLVSYFNFVGVALSMLLAVTIWIRAPRHNRALYYFAWLMCCLSLINLDTFLCYTGWMKYTLAWNDSTEPLTLLIAPLMYLSLRFLILRQPLPAWVIALHLAPAFLYALSQIGYYTEPLAVKFNAYKAAYFSEIPFAEVPEGTDYGYQLIKDQHRWLLLVGLAIYSSLSLRLWLSRRRAFGNPAGDVRISKYRFTRSILILFAAVLGLMLLVYLNYDDDGGDHFLSLFMFVATLASVFAFLSESRFFQGAWLIDKYETSSAPSDGISLEDLRSVAGQEAFFSSPNPTLKALADAIGAHPNAVSRLINQQTDGNFNDFVNGFRIRLAQQRLLSETYRNFTVEAIGQSVGFRSKSAFYQAFKKQTGLSPSQYLKSAPRQP